MKRFVNEYGMARAARILEDNLVERDTLALWTLLAIRWPALADYLEAHPRQPTACWARRTRVTLTPDALKLLIERVCRARSCFPHGGPLTQEIVERCTGRRSR